MKTAHHALLEWAERTPDRIFLHQPIAGQFRETSWSEAANDCSRIANALRSFDLSPGDRVAILAKNSAEWILADIAIAMAGLISVPIYPTAGPETIAYVLSHSGAKVVFVGKLDDPDSAMSGLSDGIPRIAFPYQEISNCDNSWQNLIDDNEPLSSIADPKPEDAMTILYTSGSTGVPKGVVISYKAYHYASHAAAATANMTSADRLLSYLPLAHITERTCTAGPAIYFGTECSFVESLQTFVHDLKRAAPTVFISVPRLWVKFQSGVHAKIPAKKLRLLLSIPVLSGIVAKKLRNELGFGSCRQYGSGSAPISPATLRWYCKIGVDIGEGWGMSETSGLSCGNSPFEERKLGTIGSPVPGTEMKLSEAGEILIRSPGLFTEYYKNPELTAEVFTEDGFFHTGDKAFFDESLNAYTITGRVKDIFKSAKGKYVTPVPIEAKLSSNSYVEQVCVMGAGLPAPVAVVVLTESASRQDKDDLAHEIEETLDNVNATLESHEKMSNVLIAKEGWTTENGLLTPTLKVKRDKLEEKYQSAIAQSFSTAVVWES